MWRIAWSVDSGTAGPAAFHVRLILVHLVAAHAGARRHHALGALLGSTAASGGNGKQEADKRSHRPSRQLVRTVTRHPHEVCRPFDAPSLGPGCSWGCSLG